MFDDNKDQKARLIDVKIKLNDDEIKYDDETTLVDTSVVDSGTVGKKFLVLKQKQSNGRNTLIIMPFYISVTEIFNVSDEELSEMQKKGVIIRH